MNKNTCHCGTPDAFEFSDHCGNCFCEQFESPDCGQQAEVNPS